MLHGRCGVDVAEERVVPRKVLGEVVRALGAVGIGHRDVGEDELHGIVVGHRDVEREDVSPSDLDGRAYRDIHVVSRDRIAAAEVHISGEYDGRQEKDDGRGEKHDEKIAPPLPRRHVYLVVRVGRTAPVACHVIASLAQGKLAAIRRVGRMRRIKDLLEPFHLV